MIGDETPTIEESVAVEPEEVAPEVAHVHLGRWIALVVVATLVFVGMAIAAMSASSSRSEAVSERDQSSAQVARRERRATRNAKNDRDVTLREAQALRVAIADPMASVSNLVQLADQGLAAAQRRAAEWAGTQRCRSGGIQRGRRPSERGRRPVRCCDRPVDRSDPHAGWAPGPVRLSSGVAMNGTGTVIRRSAPSIAALLGLLVAVAAVAVVVGRVPLATVVAFGAAFVLFDYLVAPNVIEWLIPAQIGCLRRNLIRDARTAWRDRGSPVPGFRRAAGAARHCRRRHPERRSRLVARGMTRASG